MQPENGHPTTPLAPRDAERQLTLRTVAAHLFTGSAIFWALFGLAQLLVFEIADAVGTVEAASKRASLAGLAMFLANLLAIGATTGLLGRGRFARFVIEGLLVGVIAVSLLLYPTATFAEGVKRLSMQLVVVLGLGLAIRANYFSRKAEA